MNKICQKYTENQEEEKKVRWQKKDNNSFKRMEWKNRNISKKRNMRAEKNNQKVINIMTKRNI